MMTQTSPCECLFGPLLLNNNMPVVDVGSFVGTVSNSPHQPVRVRNIPHQPVRVLLSRLAG